MRDPQPIPEAELVTTARQLRGPILQAIAKAGSCGGALWFRGLASASNWHRRSVGAGQLAEPRLRRSRTTCRQDRTIRGARRGPHLSQPMSVGLARGRPGLCHAHEMAERAWLRGISLPPGTTRISGDDTSGCRGFCARFHPDGELVHFGVYAEGSCATCWALHLEHGGERGSARLAAGSGGTADYEVYCDGAAERFDAWSDNSPNTPIPYQEWVESWIACIGRIDPEVKKKRGRKK